jgi:hypothetical protein
MPLSLDHVTFDCDDAAAGSGPNCSLALSIRTNAYFATVGKSAGIKPVLMFIQVPDKTPGKNVIHLDFHAADYREQIDRAISLGAEHIGDFDEYGAKWATLADPEGNLFDIGAE